VPELVETARNALPDALAHTQPQWLEAGPGCHQCKGFAYKGRLGIYELVSVTTAMQQQIVNNADAEALWQQARHQGARSLREDGLVKAWQGLTSVSEVLRVTAS
jgi:general secretion pathway protein E